MLLLRVEKIFYLFKYSLNTMGNGVIKSVMKAMIPVLCSEFEIEFKIYHDILRKRHPINVCESV